MTTWVLILFFHVGVLGKGNSNAATTVPGFTSMQECQEAGKSASRLVDASVKQMNFVCVKQTIK